MHKVMREFKDDKLHSGSKSGQKVRNRKQAIAIGMSEARKAEGKSPRRGSSAKAREKRLANYKM